MRHYNCESSDMILYTLKTRQTVETHIFLALAVYAKQLWHISLTFEISFNLYKKWNIDYDVYIR